MYKNSYELWVNWHMGLIKRKLTNEEQCEINANDFAMHLLLPTKSIELSIAPYGESIFEHIEILNQLQQVFAVPYEVLIFKIQYVLDKNNNEKKHSEKTYKKRKN